VKKYQRASLGDCKLLTLRDYVDGT